MTSTITSLLSSKQEEELQRSILDYFHSRQLHSSYNAFSQEVSILDNIYDGKQRYNGLMEKKWTSVIRLQKKIVELETKINQLTSELSLHPSLKKPSTQHYLPRPPSIHSLSGHRAPITSVAFHPKYSLLASSSEDNSIRIWDVDLGELDRVIKHHTNTITEINWSNNGNYLASCSTDLKIKIFDSQANYSCIKTLMGHDHSVSSVIFLPNDTKLVSGSRDKTIKIWDMATGYCIKTLQGHLDWIRQVRCCDDGINLVSCANDQTVRIWNIETGKCRMELRGHEHVIECVCFLPLSAHPFLARQFELNEKSKKSDQSIRYVASGSRDKSVRIWDIVTRRCMATLSGHDNWVRSLSPHPNGHYLMSTSDDKSLRFWDLESGRCSKTMSDAHEHFITCGTFAKANINAKSTTQTPLETSLKENGLENDSSVNTSHPVDTSNNKNFGLVATGGVDQIVRIWGCS